MPFSYDPDKPAHRGPVARRRAGRDGRDRRPDRRRQDHAGQPDHAVLRARRRRHHASTATTSPRCAAATCARTWAWCSRTPGCSAARSARTSRYGNPDATEEQILEAAEATLRRPLRALAARTATTPSSTTRAAACQRRREAAAHHRPRLPRQPDDPHPRRGHQLGRHPHRGADPAGDGRAALEPHQLRDRPPALDDPRRRHHPGDGARRTSSSRATTTSCSSATAPTPASTTASSPAPPPSSTERHATRRAKVGASPTPAMG